MGGRGATKANNSMAVRIPHFLSRLPLATSDYPWLPPGYLLATFGYLWLALATSDYPLVTPAYLLATSGYLWLPLANSGYP